MLSLHRGQWGRTVYVTDLDPDFAILSRLVACRLESGPIALDKQHLPLNDHVCGVLDSNAGVIVDDKTIDMIHTSGFFQTDNIVTKRSDKTTFERHAQDLRSGSWTEHRLKETEETVKSTATGRGVATLFPCRQEKSGRLPARAIGGFVRLIHRSQFVVLCLTARLGISL